MVIVLVASRVPEGPVSPRYAAGGGALVDRGALLAGDLSPWQARMLLGLRPRRLTRRVPRALLDEHLT